MWSWNPHGYPLDSHQSRHRMAEHVGEQLHPLVDPGCYHVNVAGLEVPLASPGKENVPWLDDDNPRSPKSSHPDVEADELAVVGRHAVV